MYNGCSSFLPCFNSRNHSFYHMYRWVEWKNHIYCCGNIIQFRIVLNHYLLLYICDHRFLVICAIDKHFLSEKKCKQVCQLKQMYFLSWPCETYAILCNKSSFAFYWKPVYITLFLFSVINCRRASKLLGTDYVIFIYRSKFYPSILNM